MRENEDRWLEKGSRMHIKTAMRQDAGDSAEAALRSKTCDSHAMVCQGFKADPATT
jgi:hypothetical protein